VKTVYHRHRLSAWSDRRSLAGFRMDQTDHMNEAMTQHGACLLRNGNARRGRPVGGGLKCGGRGGAFLHHRAGVGGSLTGAGDRSVGSHSQKFASRPQGAIEEYLAFGLSRSTA
jgi:hypothetical protein